MTANGALNRDLDAPNKEKDDAALKAAAAEKL